MSENHFYDVGIFPFFFPVTSKNQWLHVYVFISDILDRWALNLTVDRF